MLKSTEEHMLQVIIEFTGGLMEKIKSESIDPETGEIIDCDIMLEKINLCKSIITDAHGLFYLCNK